ncbi:F-box protein At1g61340-like [Andrographis paniculata]|uniref:F-box protein At1g61340-like n=1 Tax=Andrographis paniculata TaxID=175694 RepID=UPI0021E7AC15|nr:F-box protein At1g61340-like [Andrographis paniculata]
MEVAKKFGSSAKRGNTGYGLGLVRSTSFGRKRIALPDVCIDFGDIDDDSIPLTPFKRRCCEDSLFVSHDSLLEGLPQELLIRILCNVEHEDLKRLFFVSKAIREAAVLAKKSHFAYRTPQKVLMFRGVEDLSNSDDVQAPNAPKQLRVPRARLSAKKLSEVSVALFADDDDDEKGAVWPRRGSIAALETEV